MTNQRNRPNQRNFGNRNLLLVGATIIAILGLLIFAVSDRPSSGGKNVSQTSNPTNAPGTSKQP